MNIYVGNLPYTVTEEQLRAAFADFGEVTSANVIMDRMSGQSKGFGFVEMPNNSEAEEAINALNESAFNGRNIKVNQARRPIPLLIDPARAPERTPRLRLRIRTRFPMCHARPGI